MKIDVFTLTDGENRFHLKEDPSVLELPETLKVQTPVEVEGALAKGGTHFILKGVVTCTLDMECSRCLEAFQYPLRIPLKALYTVNSEGTNHRENSEMILISRADQSIDLTKLVREAILLAVPLKPICREACKGLCPRCGINLNRGKCDCITRSPDPRWVTLEALRE